MQVKKFVLFLLAFIIYSFQGQLIAQEAEIDFSYGAHSTKVKFVHDSPVDNDSEGFESLGNSNFAIGITSPIANNNWFLRTEFGLLRNNTFIEASYKVDEGFGSYDVHRLSYLNNQRLYIGILPEFRYTKSITSIKLAAGVLLGSDLSNTYTSLDKVLTPDESVLGLKINGGIHIMGNKIGAGINLSCLSFVASEVENRYFPKISYSMIVYNFSIIYKI